MPLNCGSTAAAPRGSRPRSLHSSLNSAMNSAAVFARRTIHLHGPDVEPLRDLAQERLAVCTVALEYTLTCCAGWPGRRSDSQNEHEPRPPRLHPPPPDALHRHLARRSSGAARPVPARCRAFLAHGISCRTSRPGWLFGQMLRETSPIAPSSRSRRLHSQHMLRGPPPASSASPANRSRIASWPPAPRPPQRLRVVQSRRHAPSGRTPDSVVANPQPTERSRLGLPRAGNRASMGGFRPATAQMRLPC